MADATGRGAARGWSALTADPRALARAFDEAPYAAWINAIEADGRYRCVAINAAAAEPHGVPPAELLGTDPAASMPADDYAEYDAVVRQAVETRRPATRRFRLNVSEPPRFFDLVITPIVDEHGQVDQVLGISRDITEETTSLRTSAERFRGVFAAAHDATILVASDGTCLDANPSAERLLGLERAHIVGSNGGDFLPRDTDVVAGLARLPRGTTQSGELTITRPDGAVRLTEFHAVADVVPDVHLVMLHDVTERAESEARLRESEARFRLISDTAPTLIWTTDEQGNIDSLNRAWLEFRGRTQDEEIAAGAAITHPDDQEKVLSAWQTALATRSAYSLTTRMQRADGAWRWLKMHAAPRNRPDGTFAGFIGAAIDISEQIDAEHALRAERDQQRALVDALHDGLIVTDADGVLTEVNQEFVDMTGHDARDAVGTGRPYPWWPDELHDTFVDDFGNLAESGRRDVDTIFQHRDGSRFPVAISVAAIRDGETTVGTVSTVRDITAREDAAEALRRSEERFRALVENAPDLVCVLDRNGCVVDASPSVRRILGYEPGQLSDRPIFDFVHPDDRHGVVERFQGLLAREGIGPRDEFRFRAADGSWRTIVTVGNNLLDNPAVGGIVVNASDVTETRRLAASLVQSQKLEAVGRLAGGVAHDFNNLLTAISGYAEVLLTDLPDDSEHRDDVVELARAAGRATTLVQQLLTFGRKQPTQPTVLDVRDVVSSMEPMLRQMLGSAVGLACGGPRLPANVTVDRSQLEQVLLNLVVNARDACEAATSQEDGGQAGGQIVIRTESVDLDRAALVDVPGAAPGRYVVLSVRDDGCGMDGATREQVLEPFFTTKRDQGTGFGLSIVHGIVSEHGGHVTVQSEPGQGTTVRVALPESVEAEDPLSVAERSAAEPFRTSA